MNLINNWFKVIGKYSKKLHYLNNDLTLCGISKTQLQPKERTGNYTEDKLCKICLTVLKTYDNLDNTLIHKSASNNLRSNQKDEFVFIRHHQYITMYFY